MNLFLKIILISHVFLGLLGVVAFYAVWMGLLKQKLSLKILRFASLTGLIAFILSWLNGVYYVVYYSKIVRTIIKTGQYSWAHNIFMEAKEHIFLFVPFLSAVVFLILWFLGDKLENESNLKRSTVALTGLVTVLGIIITLSGLLISGAVR